MKNLVVAAISFLLVFTGPTFGQANGLIAGVASIDGKPLANIAVRLRNVENGQLVGNTAADATGQFSFSGLNPGNYVVEMVSADGTIIGTSVNIPLATGVMAATNVAVGVSAAALGATGGVAAAGAAAAGAAATAGMSATLIAVSAVGVTLGTTAFVAVDNDASPSR
jgi:Carboxypeptidase regulatory-like domain